MSQGEHLNASRWAVTKQRLIGDGASIKREKDDFYPTPPEATRALLDVETFHGGAWEPACGDGAICRVFEERGLPVAGSDLVNRGFGETGVDFLLEYKPRAPNIVTNPPFKLAVPFVRHSLNLAEGKVAMLLKLAFLEGRERADLFRTTPFARVWVFSRRLAFVRGTPHAATPGGGMLAFAWFVWEHGYVGKPEIGWL